jgi:hypothetical protein
MMTRIESSTNQIVASVALGAGNPQEIAYAGGSLWVGLFDTPTVVQVSAHRVPVKQRRASCMGPLPARSNNHNIGGLWNSLFSGPFVRYSFDATLYRGGTPTDRQHV